MKDEVTRYGFTYGCAEVTRVCTVRVAGKVKGRVVAVTTPRSRIELWVTPTGLIRVLRHEKRGGR